MSRVSIQDKEEFRLAVLAIQQEVMHVERLSRSDAQARLLAQLGISTTSHPTLLDVWTQRSRLKYISTIEDQYLCGLAWIGFHLLSHNPEWLESLLHSTGVELEYPLVNMANRPILKGLFRRVRVNDHLLGEDEIEAALDLIFSHSADAGSPPLPEDGVEYGFQINRIHTDAANHLYIELCGITRTPIFFAVRNTLTGRTWQSLGRRLEGPCRVYRAIWDITSPNTWYDINIVCHDESYGAQVRILTSDVKPYFCADVRIDGPRWGFSRTFAVE